MEIQYLLFICLLCSSVVVSQAFSYIIALGNVQESLSAPAYIEVRHLTDSNYRRKYAYVVCGSLAVNCLLAGWCAMNPGSFLFRMSALACICTVVDIWLAVKGNGPVNELINTWRADHYPADWQRYRDRWLHIFRWRQLAMITGFIALLAGALFG